MKREFISESEEATSSLGHRLGRVLEGKEVIALCGELGAGKTIFVKGLALGLGVSETFPVTSPSFSLIHEYPGRIELYHIDFYRLKNPEELEGIDLEWYLYGDGVSVIEWADKFFGVLPEESLNLQFEVLSEGVRKISFSSRKISVWEDKIKLAWKDWLEEG